MQFQTKQLFSDCFTCDVIKLNEGDNVTIGYSLHEELLTDKFQIGWIPQISNV